jgi:hypothetical protein
MNTPNQFTKKWSELTLQFRQLPQQSQRVVMGVFAATVLFIVVGFVLWRSHVHHSPEYAFRVIDGIESRADIGSRRDYMTAQGLKVINYALDQQKGPSTAQKMQYQPHQVRGTACFFPFTQGSDAGYLQFEQHGVWQFHDIVITRHGARDIELSVAYAIDHPILAALKTADWGEVFTNFVKGFMIGYGLGGG